MVVVCGATTQYRDLAFHSSSLGTCEVLRTDIFRPSPYPNFQDQVTVFMNPGEGVVPALGISGAPLPVMTKTVSP